MTLSLDEVRATRFHMARRNGYEVTDVDTFVDKVEATLTQMTEENDMLKEQVSALKSGGWEGYPDKQDAAAGASADPVDTAELERLRVENAELRASGSADSALRQENDDLRRQIEQLKAAAQQESAPAVVAPVLEKHEEGEVQRVVVTTAAEASPVVVQLVQYATEQAERTLADADALSKSTLEQAEQRAGQLTSDAQARADQIESEARTNAERAEREAQERADSLDSETDRRRGEMLGALEGERATLVGSVDQLRHFESTFRSNLVAQLRGHIDSIEQAHAEPADAPEAVTEQADTAAAKQGDDEADTPRLDRLISEG